MKISVFGLGYVGAVSCGCLAELGHEVIGVDVAPSKVDLINAGRAPIVEPGLAEILERTVASGRVRATTNTAEAVAASDAALVCVGTPSTPSGGVDSGYLENACREIGTCLSQSKQGFFAVLVRSTSLAPIHQRLQDVLTHTSGRALCQGIGYACHPEFLRESVAVDDFYHPPKIVFGVSDARTEAVCRQLYPTIDAATYVVPIDVASMIKYADNCFHALKVTFANEIGLLSRELGIDAHAVMEVFCRDQKLNISPKYLKPGAAFGGSCLPKDLRAILDMAREVARPLPMLHGVLESNRVQIDALLRRVISPSRPTVGLVGLAFKEGTDDVRESPMVTVVEQLCGKGHPVVIYDGCLSLGTMVGRNRSFAFEAIPHLADLLTQDLQRTVDAADVVVISHRLKPDVWQQVRWRAGQRVIDLVNIPELHDVPGYEGLYW